MINVEAWIRIGSCLPDIVLEVSAFFVGGVTREGNRSWRRERSRVRVEEIGVSAPVRSVLDFRHKGVVEVEYVVVVLESRSDGNCTR